MNVILVDPIQPARDYPLGPPAAPAFPEGSLLCLAAHLAARSRYGCQVLDLNMHSDPPEALRQVIQATPQPRLILLRVQHRVLPEACAITLFIREHFPDIRIGWFGPYPTQAPHDARTIPGVDFVICGDPEPAMRGMLDFYGLSQRVTRVPGLWVDNPPLHPGPVWLESLENRDLTFWTACWASNLPTLRAAGSGEIRLRLTRGQSGQPCDRAHPEWGIPQRMIGLNELAVLFDKLPSFGVTSIVMDDPPGTWTVDLLETWCLTLDTYRNSRKWAFTLLPSIFPDSVITRLRNAWCGGVEFLFPSSDPTLLKKYGCSIRAEQLKHTIGRLRASGINSRAVFWIGGPEESPGEAERVYSTLKHLGFPEYHLQPFPYHPDSALAQELRDSEYAPDLGQWVQRATKLEEGLPPLSWGGPGEPNRLRTTAKEVFQKLDKNPVLWMRGLIQSVRNINWQDELDRRIPTWLKPGGVRG